MNYWQHGIFRAQPPDLGHVRVELSRREPAQLDRPPERVARVAVELVSPVGEEGGVAALWEVDERDDGVSRVNVPGAYGAVPRGGGDEGAVG